MAQLPVDAFNDDGKYVQRLTHVGPAGIGAATLGESALPAARYPRDRRIQSEYILSPNVTTVVPRDTRTRSETVSDTGHPNERNVPYSSRLARAR